MKSLMLALILSLTLMAAPSIGQTPAAPQPQTPPAQPAPATPQPPRPFPEGAKLAYIDIQRIASESSEGKSSTAKVQALNQKKVNELNEKQKALQASQQKLQDSGAVMNDSARGELEKNIEKMQRDIQRMTQDAQAEVQDLQQSLQIEFQRKLMPVIQSVATEKGIHVLFSRADAGIVFADPGLDITNEILARFDKTTGSAPAGQSAAPPAPKPPAPKPPEAKPPAR
jgi:outer membrane protein